MAEFLIKAVSVTHSDPDKDTRGCYKRGDIVDIRPNGFAWGKEEGLPKFVVVQVSDVSVAAAKKYMDPERDTNGFMTRRRIYRVLVDSVPNAVKIALRDTGRYETTWDAIKAYVHNKITDTTGG